MRELLGVPEKFRIAGLLALGMPAEKLKPHTLEEIDWNKVKNVTGE